MSTETDWVIVHLLDETTIQKFSIDETFEEWMCDVYPESFKIGWIEFDTVSAIKQLDPVSWQLAKSEWLDKEEQDGRIVSFDHGATYVRVESIENLLETERLGDDPQ